MRRHVNKRLSPNENFRGGLTLVNERQLRWPIGRIYTRDELSDQTDSSSPL